MPEARKTPESRRFAGLGHDRAAVVAGRNERLRENSPIDDGSMGYGCADTAGMGVEFPILGDKIAAKRIAKEHRVPLVPGTDYALENLAEAQEKALEIGFPLLIKAAMGGGGKGMRVVRDATELKEQMPLAIGEAKAAFGDGSVFLERYIEQPRHIEIQILADRQGNVLHLFERDCSIQRRHQKVVEESPAQGLKQETREALGKAAIAIAKACAYEGAGTVEFIMDKEQRFYFLEVNTRLQVEHPVTEMITGIDLVKEQIKIARGEKLSFTQDDLQIQGHAIELRVYAEDPANNFLPNIGNLNTYSLPLGNGIRVDNGYEQGMEVPIYYDPMLAKLIAYGKDRSEAIERMKRAIDDFEIEGVETTLTFGSFVMNHPVFVQGPYDTHFVSQHFSPEMLQTLVSEEEEAVAAIIAAVELNTRKNHKVLQTTENEQFTETAWLKNRRWS